MPTLDASREVHLLGFQGVENFRDLGGYVTRDGRTVRCQKLFRSGHLAELTEFDLKQLASLKIAGRIDLRSLVEREKMVTRWPSSLSTQLFTIDLGEENGHAVRGIFEQILQGEVSLEEARSRMLLDYANMPTNYAEIISELLLFIAEASQGAVLVHCTAGKDRTGFVVALLLEILQIPRKTILQDYLLSNRRFDADKILQRIELKHLDLAENLNSRLTVLRLLLRVESSFLLNSLNSIQNNWGGIDAYLSEQVGATPDLLQQVRRNLLTA